MHGRALKTSGRWCLSQANIRCKYGADFSKIQRRSYGMGSSDMISSQAVCATGHGCRQDGKFVIDERFIFLQT